MKRKICIAVVLLVFALLISSCKVKREVKTENHIPSSSRQSYLNLYLEQDYSEEVEKIAKITVDFETSEVEIAYKDESVKTFYSSNAIVDDAVVNPIIRKELINHTQVIKFYLQDGTKLSYLLSDQDFSALDNAINKE